jgi:hypothetical protein
MWNLKSVLAVSGKLVATVAVVATLTSFAQAQNYKTYGSQWAWCNNFGGSTIGYGWGTGSTPNMTVWWNYPNTYNLYGYPACIRGWHYGWNPSGDTMFPKQVSKINSANCTFNYSSGGTNMATICSCAGTVRSRRRNWRS